jgi:hypothetical protein
MRIQRRSNVECRTSNGLSLWGALRSDADRRLAQTPCKCLLNNLECGALPVTRRRAGQQRADRLNSLSVAADDSTNVGLTQLNSEDRRLPRRNLGEHHLIRKFDELTNDELEKLLHGSQAIQTSLFVIPR